MSLQINNLERHDSRAVFKTLNLDLRQYGQMDMFIHAESGLKAISAINLWTDSAVIRIGQDFLDNYYEVKIPLEITPFSSTATLNRYGLIQIPETLLNDLVQLKIRRNSQIFPITQFYYRKSWYRTYAVKG
jgi:cell surface protein SprA